MEWQVIPDPSTAVAALQAGEVDVVEQPVLELLPLAACRSEIASYFAWLG